MQAGRLVARGLELETEDQGSLRDVLEGQAPCVQSFAQRIDQALARRANREGCRANAADQHRDDRGRFTPSP